MIEKFRVLFVIIKTIMKKLKAVGHKYSRELYRFLSKRKFSKKRMISAAIVASCTIIILFGLAIIRVAKNSSTQPSATMKAKSDGIVGLSVRDALPHIDKTELFTDVNKEREAAGLSDLTENNLLDTSAEAKCEDMLAKNYWSHNDPSGIEPWHFISDAGYSYSAVAENLAYGYYDSAGVVTGWMNSPGHKANIMNTTYTDVGYGICSGDNYNNQGRQTIVVQHFGAVSAQSSSYSTPSTQQTPTYKPYVAPVCTKTPIPAPIEYRDASYLPVGHTRTIQGYDGYTETCTPDSTGYRPPDFTINPIATIVYVGTGT